MKAMSLLVTFVYVFASLSLGLVLLKMLIKKIWQKESEFALIATGFLLGQGLLASIWVILSLTGFLKGPVVWSILSISLLSGVFVWFDLIQIIKNIALKIIRGFIKTTLFWKIIVLIILFWLVYYALAAILLPPLGDAESFYMVWAKLISGEGKIIPQPNYFRFSQLAIFGEINYAALMVIADWTAAKFLVWFNVLAIIGLLFSFGRLLKLKVIGQIIILVMLFSSFAFTFYISDGKVDIFGAGYGLLTYYWLFLTRKHNWPTLVLIGLFLGFATVAKISNALVIVPTVAAIIIWNRWQDFKVNGESHSKLIKNILLSALVVIIFFLLTLSPNLAKNKILFGSPWVSSVSVTNTSEWSAPVWAFDNQKPLKDAIDLPKPQTPMGKMMRFVNNVLFIVVTAPLSFVFWDFPGKGGNLSVLFMVFLPLLFLFKLKDIFQKQILLMGLLGLALWLMIRSTAITPRYILATLLVFIPFYAAAVETWINKDRVIKFMVLLSILFVTIFMTLGQLGKTKKFYEVITEKFPRSSLYGENYLALDFLNQNLQENERVFLLGYYAFFLRSDLIVNLDTNQELLELINLSNQSRWQYAYDHGFRYVILQKNTPMDELLTMEYDPKPDWLETRKIYSDAYAEIYFLEKKDL